MSLYGDLPYQAVKELIDCIPESKGVGEAWGYAFAFISQESHEEIDQTIVEKMRQVFRDQHHSGGSWGVVLQLMMKYFAGQCTKEEQKKLK